MLSRLPRNAPAWLDRLSEWLEPFEVCFTHVAQRGAFRRYLLGLLSDSRRKSMSAMLERVRDPGTYQAFQHFITDAPWSADAVWRHLRATIPDRTGVLILDGTSFPKQGPHSVGVARQYCGALGKIANCQTAVTVALWTGARAWMLGAHVVPARRVADARAAHARPHSRLGPRAAQVAARADVAATGAGERDPSDRRAGRCGVWRECHAAAGVAPRAASVCLGGVVHAHDLRRHAGPRRPGGARPHRSSAIASDAGARGRRRSRPAPGPRPSPRARGASCRGATAHSRRGGPGSVRRASRPRTTGASRRLAPEVWLLCERGLGASDRTKYYLVHLPATASLRTLVRLTHQRWAIEQQYQELKDELGLDHFEGRSFAGWQRHVVLTALAYTWLQCERQRRGTHQPTLPVVRAVITEILTAHFFVTRPHYLRTMQKLADIDLRI